MLTTKTYWISSEKIIKLLLKVKPSALARGFSNRGVSKIEMKTVIVKVALLQWLSPWTCFCRQGNGQ